jgi:DNA-binding CsgD family transcriptional regulator
MSAPDRVVNGGFPGPSLGDNFGYLKEITHEMTEHLSTGQLRLALGAVGELGELRDLRDYPQAAAACLRSVIPSDLAGFNVLDLRSRRAIVAADPPDCVFDGGPEALARFIHQNPMVHAATDGETRAMRLSDFITRRALHRTELYAHVYARIPQEYQLGISLPARAMSGSPSQLMALSLGRTRRDFTDSHLRLLESVGPHFARTFERLSELALLRAIVAGDPAHDTKWVVLVDANGVVAWASPAAAIGLGVAPGHRLITNGTPAQLSFDGVPLRVRLVRDAYPGLDALHLTPLTEQLPVAALRSLGLTKRQAEVLQLALQGSTAAQIAAGLSLSRRTVEKHFEAIYGRLGATNRSQAILAALAGTRRPASTTA